MAKDAFDIVSGTERSFYGPFHQWRLPYWATGILGLLILAAVADIGYRVYDAETNPEVRLAGVALQGMPITGEKAELDIAPKSGFHYLQFRFSTESARESDAEVARAGISGTLRIDETPGGRTWEIPFLLSAKDAGIERHSSVESALGDSDAGAISLGVRYHIDYDFSPTGSGEDVYDDFFRTDFPGSAALHFQFDFQEEPAPGTRAYLSYSRLPRFFHQTLFR